MTSDVTSFDRPAARAAGGARLKAARAAGGARLRLAVLFPGQGSQAGLARHEVARLRPDLLERARAEVSDDLFERASEGTRWAQPALYCSALAGWERLRGELEPGAMAGHSLGEIAALAAAGALSAEDGLRVVAARGRLMQDAAEAEGNGGMLAVRTRDRVTLAAVADACGVAVANDNAPDQVVLSGSVKALERAEERLASLRVRFKRLPVAAAFHSPLMEPAVDGFRAVLADVDIHEPRVPVWSCVTAAPFDDVRARLAEAIVAPVRWRSVVEALRDRGAERFVETGPGRVLTGLVRRTLAEAEAAAPHEEAVHA